MSYLRSLLRHVMRRVWNTSAKRDNLHDHGLVGPMAFEGLRGLSVGLPVMSLVFQSLMKVGCGDGRLGFLWACGTSNFAAGHAVHMVGEVGTTAMLGASVELCEDPLA
jgi:hypothetical protein